VSDKKFKLFKLGKHKVRGFIAEDGAPWIIAADLAEPLELTESALRKATGDVPASHKMTLTGSVSGGSDREKNSRSLRTKEKVKGQGKGGGGARALNAVSEPGLYRIIARSHTAKREGTFAFEFVEWLSGDVLPSLRKHGAYAIDRKARALVRGLPGWTETREAGKETRKEFADTIQSFVAYAKATGSNNAQHYFEAFTKLAYKIAIGYEKPPHGRDGLGTLELLQVQLVEANLERLVASEMAAGTHYKQAFASVRERLQAIFAAQKKAA
jgi:prophage antirepressor-like protein